MYVPLPVLFQAVAVAAEANHILVHTGLTTRKRGNTTSKEGLHCIWFLRLEAVARVLCWGITRRCTLGCIAREYTDCRLWWCTLSAPPAL
jgi:hypothetical protein